MAFVDVYLALGSNLGDREENLRQALLRLDEAFGTHFKAVSRWMESPSWGFEGPAFLNGCVRYRLPRLGTPEEQATWILETCKAVERSLGRTVEGETDAEGKRIYHDRPIDIDILFYGKETIDSQRLTIPHPGISQREFVRRPLAEIAKPALKAAFPELFD